MNVMVSPFGRFNDDEVSLFTISNSNGVTVKVTNYGGIVTSIVVPDKMGNFTNVVCGFETLEGYRSEKYLETMPYFGAIIGRYGNRIHKGQFTLNENIYSLACNNGENHLHGGLVGFDKVVWKAQPVEEADRAGVQLTYLSKDMEEGYPGNLSVQVIYWLNEKDELEIEYQGETDKETPVNLTNHSYFNLSGFNEDVLNHQIQILADQYTEVDEGLIPTGNIAKVAGTPLDLRDLTLMKPGIEALKTGYDHNYVFKKNNGDLQKVAEVNEPQCGRKMEVFTTQPGMQFYTGYWVSNELQREDGTQFGKLRGFCLETQHFPDSPNKINFPSTILRPGERLREKTIYKFSVL